MLRLGSYLNSLISTSIRNTIPATTRTYCQLTSLCWNCQATSDGNYNIFCSKCSSIQKVPKIDYFNLFGIQKGPKVNMKDLSRRFRNIQSDIHPDKFSRKSQKEQQLSSEWSSLVNKAYKTLQAPLARGEYLLKQHGIKLPESNTIQDPEFLMEMMERNEKVEEATSKDDLLNLLTELQDDTAETSNHFASAYQSRNYAAAKNYLIKMKYLASIESTIKDRIQRSDSSSN